jgi:hypothetical protein
MTKNIYKTVEEAEKFCQETFEWDSNEVVLGRYWVVKGYITKTEDGYVVSDLTESGVT